MNTISHDLLKTPRLVVRILSAIIIVFSLMMIIGEAMENNKRGTGKLLTLYTIIQLILMGIGLLGLALAWKREPAGSIITLLAVSGVFIINPSAILLLMFIFPANAILFIVMGYPKSSMK